MIINILGTEYRIVEVDEMPNTDADGNCDRSIHQIMIIKEWKQELDSLSDMSVYKNQLLRHEIIHAFLFESGLVAASGWTEEQVDWLAVQFPKLASAFMEADCID